MNKLEKDSNLLYLKKRLYLFPMLGLWILVRLGSFGIGFGVFILQILKNILLAPFLILKKIWNFCQTVFHPLNKRQRAKTSTPFLHLHKHRGRPRSQPILVFVFQKNK